MGRPKRFRRIFQEPQIKGFNPVSEEGTIKNRPIKINIDEIEAIRIRDYVDIKQKNAAEMMDISQPTFHRTLYSARRKIAKALVEGRNIIIKGGDFMTDKIGYKCKNCGFEWYSPKEYKNCPECKSEDIYKISESDETPTPAGQPGMGRRRGYGGAGMGAGPPRVCKCISCGYETAKTPGVPCRNSKCPKCGALMCGAD
ncbi:MAG: DUF134 domain-containing protein [Methanobacterium sp.]|nr:DUF134 domain-containing protein [Methanobacterium sp.]